MVDVETVDPFVGTRASPSEMAVYSLQECWKALSSFLRHVWISERISPRVFPRTAVLDGPRLCLRTAFTNANDLVSSGRDNDCSLDSWAVVRSVSRLRRSKVASRAVHSSSSAVLPSSLDEMSGTAYRYILVKRTLEASS